MGTYAGLGLIAKSDLREFNAIVTLSKLAVENISIGNVCYDTYEINSKDASDVAFKYCQNAGQSFALDNGETLYWQMTISDLANFIEYFTQHSKQCDPHDSYLPHLKVFYALAVEDIDDGESIIIFYPC